eukprot:gene4459-4715_t
MNAAGASSCATHRFKPCESSPLQLSSDEQQAKAVRGLLDRVLGPKHAGLFQLVLQSKPVGSHGFFSLEVLEDGVIVIEGSSGTLLASGVHWFLKYYANSSVSWDQTGGLQLNADNLKPAALARLAEKGKLFVERAVPFSFYQNVVTMSYSMAFWEWDRWEAEIDWMALQGVNMPLMPLGMEALQVATFTSLGLTQQQLQDFFPGPAFLAWGRMGNIQGYAGPLPESYMAKQLSLAQRVVQRMREFGMTPVYPAFAGFVPRALAELHPEAALTPASNWCHFPASYCCPLLLDPSDPLFADIGAAYIRTLRSHLGWDTASYYIADTFNEMKPASSSPEYLSGVSASVFAGMTAADPHATWVMQAWLFFSDARFWQPAQVQALLGGVPRGRMLLLDLFAEEHPVWSRTSALYGHPFIWCMLHNFGGNLEMYGALPSVAEGVSAAMAAAPENLMGVGMAPEGIEQNPAVYEFMSEMAFKGQAAAAAAPGGLAAWFKGYAQRRYAAAGPLPVAAAAALEGAWQLLARNVYSCRDQLHNTVVDIPTSRPGLSRAEIVGWGLGPHLWYDVGEVRAAWELLLHAAAASPALADSSSAFNYDLLDVSRELMSKISGRFWADVVEAYRGANLAGLRANGTALLTLLADMDELLGSHKGFLLGPVLARARAYARTADTKASQLDQQVAAELAEQQLGAFYEWNLRTQLTIWGTSAAAGDSEVSDYANKEWSGLIASFYLPRWRAWLSRLEADLLLGRQYDAAAWRLEVLMLTYRWISTGSANPECPMQVTDDEGEQQAVAAKSVFAASQPAISAQRVAMMPAGKAVDLSSRAYEVYARLLSPGCANTSATAAAAAAAAAAGMAVPASVASAPSASTVVSAAAAIMVGAAGAARQGPAASMVEEVVA